MERIISIKIIEQMIGYITSQMVRRYIKEANLFKNNYIFLPL